MVNKINDIANQKARIGSVFNFTLPNNIFEGDDLLIDATIARKKKGLTLSQFWINFNKETRTFNGIPITFEDEGNLEIEVIALSLKDGSTASAYFHITTYDQNVIFSTASVVPRTSVECDYVITAANVSNYPWETIQGPCTVGFDANTTFAEGITVNRLNGSATGPVLMTNVNGVMHVTKNSGEKTILFRKSNYVKLIGQSFDNTVNGLIVSSGNPAPHTLPDGSPDPSFDFDSNGGGSAIEVEDHCMNHIEIYGVHVPYSGSAGIKIRTKLDIYRFETFGDNLAGSTELTISGNINSLLNDYGYINVVGVGNLEYVSYTGNTYTLAQPLPSTVPTNTNVTSCAGVRFYHDMNWVKVHHCYVENANTECVYLGEGFGDGRTTGGDGITELRLPADIRFCSISWNIFINSGWDIQAKNIVEGGLIKGNYGYNISYRSRAAQRYGLFFEYFVGEVSHNYIDTVQGTGFRTYFGGPVNMFSNILTNCANETDTTQRQAVYGAITGTVVEAYSMDTGGYVLTNYRSRSDLGTDPAALEVNFVNNTLDDYKQTAIELYTLLSFRYGNNLFTNGGTTVEGTTNQFTDLGGNVFDTRGNVSYLDLVNKDFRIGNLSSAAKSSVDLSSIVSSDFNYNDAPVTDYAGACKPEGDYTEDNYNYVQYPKQENTIPYTSFAWYVADSDVESAYRPITITDKPEYTPLQSNKYYKRKITPYSLSGTKKGVEDNSNSILTT